MLLIAFAAASPHAGFTFGGVASHGYDAGVGYTSLAPMGAISSTWHLGPFETSLGVSASGLVVSRQRTAMPGVPLHVEAAFGLGAPELAVGVYTGGGIGDTAVGVYGRWLFVEDRDRAWGVEARYFGLWPSGDQGVALLARMEVGRFGPISRAPAQEGLRVTATPREDVEIPPEAPEEAAPEPAPVFHGDPYADPAEPPAEDGEE